MPTTRPPRKPAPEKRQRVPRKPAAAISGKQRVIGRPFPKGVSGNPSGRPKGVSLATVLARLLTDAEAEKIVKAVMAEARKGNMTAWASLIERTDGKVPSRTILNGGDDDDGNASPIPIRLLPPLEG